MRRLQLLSLVSIMLVAGCADEPPAEPKPVARRAAAAELTVLVVDDPGLTAKLKLLRGEWAERTGGNIVVQAGTIKQLLPGSSPPVELTADLVIYPSRYLGALVERNWLRPVRKSILENSALKWVDLFPLIRNHTTRYGGEVFAVSLGEPPLMVYSSADAERLASDTTWQQLSAPLVQSRSAVKFPLAAELIARSLALTQAGKRASLLFDADSMQPRLSEPTFVRALEEMQQLKKQDASAPLEQRVLAWPTAANLLPINADVDPAWKTVCSPLPVAQQVFNPARGQWEPAEPEPPLAIMGFGGRLASVTRATRNSASAFKLLAWIGDPDLAQQLSSESRATVWFRQSQVTRASRWSNFDKIEDPETIAATTKLLSSGNSFLIPRLPRIDDYLQTLDDAVGRAIAEDLPAEQTLAEVAKLWDSLTDRLDEAAEQYSRNSQRAAYRKHLGLDRRSN